MGPGKPGKSWNFILAFSRTGKSWKKATGPGKFWKSVKLNRISLRWSIHIINLVDKTKLSCQKYKVYGGRERRNSY